MASQDTLLLNIVMVIIICLYAFGGQKPMVSLSTATAVGLTQGIWLLTSCVLSLVARPQKKVEVCDDDDCTSIAMAREWCLRTVAYFTTIAQNPLVVKLGGVIAVLIVGRILRMSGVMTTAPLALAFSGLCHIVMMHALPDESNNEDDTSEIPAIHSAKEDPYDVAFWNELGPIVTQDDPIAKVGLAPSHILADVLHDMILK